jgi:hypothetical protein
MPVDLSPATSILEAYARGVELRLRKQKLAQDEAIRQEQLKQRKLEFSERQKLEQQQLKATSDFHGATLKQQQAHLDFQKAIAEANITRQKAETAFKYLEGIQEGSLQPPREDVFPEEFALQYPNEFMPAERYQVVPKKFKIPGTDIELDRTMLPERYGKKEQQEDVFRRIEMQAAESENRLLSQLSSREDIAAANREAAMQRTLALIAGRAKVASLKDNKTVPEFGENPISHPEISQFIVGTRVPKSKAEWERYSDAFSRIQWDDGSKGFTPFNQKEIDEMKSAGTSKRAVEFAASYSEALSSGNIEEILRIGSEIKKVIPSLKDATNAKALGVLSKQDLQMLEANLPSMKTEMLSRFFNRKGALESLRSGWNSQRAKDLYKLYKQRVNTLLGNRSSGQKKYYDEQYSLRPELSKTILKAWGELKEE